MRGKGDTVAGGSGGRGVGRNGGDTIGRLSPGEGLAVLDIGTDGHHVFTIATLKSTVLGVVGSIVGTADTVVNVFTEVSGVGLGVVTDFETEVVTTDEEGPVPGLLERVVLATVAGEGVGVDETTDRVSTAILSSRVELTTKVKWLGLNVDLGLVNETGDLDVSRALDELETLEGTLRNETSTFAGLGTPGDFDTLSVTNGGQLGRSKETEIIQVVYQSGLTHGSLAFGGRVTDVVPSLRSTVGGVLVDLVGDSGVRDNLVDERVRDEGLGGGIRRSSQSDYETRDHGGQRVNESVDVCVVNLKLVNRPLSCGAQ